MKNPNRKCKKLLKKVRDEIADLALQARADGGKKVQVWLGDEARFGQQVSVTRVWARCGSRPRAVRQTRYDYLWMMAVVCPKSGKSFGLFMPLLNGEVVTEFLDQFSKQLEPDVIAVLIWDQAGFHTSGKIVVPDNIRLRSLPPYSPELNPVENLWHYLKSHHWSNRAHDDYDAMLDAAQDAWKRVCSIPERIKSICAAPYLAGGR